MSIIVTIKWLALVALILFSGYTVYCALTENFWKTCRIVFSLKWGRQVVVDLYLGLLLFTFFVFLIEESLLSTVAWLIPTLIFGNIIPLFYFVWNFEKIMTLFPV